MRKAGENSIFVQAGVLSSLSNHEIVRYKTIDTSVHIFQLSKTILGNMARYKPF